MAASIYVIVCKSSECPDVSVSEGYTSKEAAEKVAKNRNEVADRMGDYDMSYVVVGPVEIKD